jgi:iron complex outermembrane recepter protein
VKTSKITSRLSAGTALATFALIVSPALAQTAPADAPAGGDSEAIIVTGSRIASPNLQSVAPVTVVSQQDLKLQGVTRVEDLLNSLPQVFASQASTVSNGADGTATVDLRGLGPTRTLVLVNGRRLLPGDPGTSAADLNAIPDSLVKSVQVLTGGASTTYGADAVTGVVNFIMDTDFTGIKLDTQYSFYQHKNRNDLITPLLASRRASGFVNYNDPKSNVIDGQGISANLTIGSGFEDGRGHATAYFGYRKVNEVTQNRRDYSSCTIQNRNPTAGNPNPLQCGGSATSAEGNFFDSTSNPYTIGTGQTFNAGLTRYNFAPTNYFQRPDERYTAGFFAHYDVNDSIKPYMEFMFMDDRSIAQIAPSGDFGNTLTINCDNPLLSAQQKGIVCRPDNLVNGFLGSFPLTANTNAGSAPIAFFDPRTGTTYNKGYFQLLRRNVEGGPRRADFEHTQYRGVIGTKGDLNDAISYDAYYQYGRTVYSQTYSNEFSVARLNKALDAVTGPAGTVVCRSVTDGSDPNCVPYNVFTLNSVTPGALNYLGATGLQRGVVSQQVANFNLTADLGKYGFKSPAAEDGLALNVGFEYRRDALELVTDNAFSTGDLTGQGAPTLPIKGSFFVTEFFGEARMPIVQNSFIHSLSLEGAYRYSSYKTSGGREYKTDTYKFGAEFAPVRDIIFRAAYNRAARAPNLQNLFAAQFVGLDGSSDPCAGAAVGGLVNGNTAAQCARTGVTAAQFGKISANPAAQYNGLLGGEPNLTPEKATTKTFGVVLQPRFIPRFSLTVDYFDIKVTNAIQRIGADTIVTTCLNTASPLLCGLIQRNPVGSLWLTSDGFVRDLQRNIGGVSTKGIDVNAAYTHDIGSVGDVSLSFVGTYLDKLITDTGVSTPYDCTGLYGTQCGVPAPKWRHKARVGFNAPSGFGLSFQWRFVGPVSVDYTSKNPSLNGPFLAFGSKIAAQSYFDLATTIRFEKRFTFRLGMNNMLDREPPLTTSGIGGAQSACGATVCNGNTYPAVYDALGRYVYAGVTLDF